MGRRMLVMDASACTEYKRIDRKGLHSDVAISYYLISVSKKITRGTLPSHLK